MQRVNAHKDESAIRIIDSDFLLHHAILIHTHKTAKTSYSVVNMNHIIAWLKLLYLLESESHLTLVCLVRLQVILVESVKYLMVGKVASLVYIVYKAFVDSLANRFKHDLFMLALCHLREDVLKTRNLFLAIRKDIYPIALRLKP